MVTLAAANQSTGVEAGGDGASISPIAAFVDANLQGVGAMMQTGLAITRSALQIQEVALRTTLDLWSHSAGVTVAAPAPSDPTIVAPDLTSEAPELASNEMPVVERPLCSHAGPEGEPNILDYSQMPRAERIKAMMEPKVIAVVGATDRNGSVGAGVLKNLQPFIEAGGRVYFVNDRREQINGVKCYAKLTDIPETVDLAVVVTPSETVAEIAQHAHEAGVGGVVCITAGFREIGASGREREHQVLEALAGRPGTDPETRVPLNGPNCLGLINLLVNMNATFAAQEIIAGRVAFIGQSGAMVTGALESNIPFCFLNSTGNMADITWGDNIVYLTGKEGVSAIVGYMEGPGEKPEDVAQFLAAAAACDKPILIAKARITKGVESAAKSHSGSIAGSEESLEALFQSAGVVRLTSMDDLFNVSRIASTQPLPAGRKLTIIANCGGPGVMTTGAFEAAGGELAPMGEALVRSISAVPGMPSLWSHGNPADVVGDATPQRTLGAIDEVFKYYSTRPGETNGLLIALTNQSQTNPVAFAEGLVQLMELRKPEFPVMVSLVGDGPEMTAAKRILTHAGVPCLPTPDAAAVAFVHLARAVEMRQVKREPLEVPEWVETARPVVSQIIDEALAAGQACLTEYQAKQVLQACGIPTTDTRRADTAAEMLQHAADFREETGDDEMLFVVKLDSGEHKSDCEGVIVGVRSDRELAAAFDTIKANAAKYGVDFNGVTIQPMVDLRKCREVIFGTARDELCGPTVIFGPGGIDAEVYKDQMRVRLAPLSEADAHAMMMSTPAGRVLEQKRTKRPHDIQGLSAMLSRLSWLPLLDPRIKGLDGNPTASRTAADGGPIVLDARIELNRRATAPANGELESVVPIRAAHAAKLFRTSNETAPPAVSA